MTSTRQDSEIWDRRRRNLRAIIAVRGYKPANLAVKAGLGVNTVNAFLNGSGSSSLKLDTLERVCGVLGIHSVSMLDAENPISEIRNDLYGMVQAMGEDQAKAALEFLKENFPDLQVSGEETEIN